MTSIVMSTSQQKHILKNIKGSKASRVHSVKVKNDCVLKHSKVASSSDGGE